MYIENLNGYTAFISGASCGIGLAVAKMLASNGVNLIISARRIEKLEELKQSLENKYKIKVLALKIDFSDNNDILNKINSIDDEWKNIDILINNAGLAIGKDSYDNNNIEDILQVIRVNCEGLAICSRIILPYIKKSKNGHIVNISSVAADEGYYGGAIYCATKSFVEVFSESLRAELIDTPIRISTIKPGAVNTDFSIVRFKGDINKANSVYEGFEPLYAEDIADNIEYILTRKKHVQISSMSILATNQANATMIHRK